MTGLDSLHRLAGPGWYALVELDAVRYVGMV